MSEQKIDNEKVTGKLIYKQIYQRAKKSKIWPEQDLNISPRWVYKVRGKERQQKTETKRAKQFQPMSLWYFQSLRRTLSKCNRIWRGNEKTSMAVSKNVWTQEETETPNKFVPIKQPRIVPISEAVDDVSCRKNHNIYLSSPFFFFTPLLLKCLTVLRLLPVRFNYPVNP